MIGILILLGSFLFFLIAAAGIMKTKELEQENRLLHSYMRSMEEFYEGIQSRIEAVRKYRHDLAKHIQTLEALLEEKEQDDGVKEYMEDLKYRYEELKKHEFCTDELVNSILTIKEEQCRERGIPLDIRVQDCIYTGVEEVDLVGLLHNLLDNAIEANERIPAGEKKGVWFSMEHNGEEIVVGVKNCLKNGEINNLASLPSCTDLRCQIDPTFVFQGNIHEQNLHGLPQIIFQVFSSAKA